VFVLIECIHSYNDNGLLAVGILRTFIASVLSGSIVYSIHYLKVFAFYFYRHAHPGSPYVFGLAEVDHDVEFPDPMPVVGTLCLNISIQ
jgi:hypothetical protein